MQWTTREVITRIGHKNSARISSPLYKPSVLTIDPSYISFGVALGVESMKRHMTDEGWQIVSGLEHAGYSVAGYDFVTRDRICKREWVNLTDVPTILDLLYPDILFMQDKREWEGLTADQSRDPRMKFHNVETLRERPDIFKVTVLKDAQQRPEYHRFSAEEIDCHAWVVYYHEDIVSHIAPYVRREHLIRTYHTVDVGVVPEFVKESDRAGCIISGALGGAYPLRERLARSVKKLPKTVYLQHPGYHRKGCYTPQFLQTLSRYKVAICTASMYGYALRKIIEATACGCVVITDLPSDDVLPYIDANLIRVSSTIGIREMAEIIENAISSFNEERQRYYSEQACLFYDFRVMGRKLAEDIEQLRKTYP